MPRWFTLFALAVAVFASGCGLTGESTMDAMKRRAQARADAVKVEEEQAKQRLAKAAAKFAELKGKNETAEEPTVNVPVKSAAPTAKTPAVAKAPVGPAAKGSNAEKVPGAAAKVAAVRPPLPVK